jgi:hypothetical protein
MEGTTFGVERLEDKKAPLVAWDLVCKTKRQVGFGVINPSTQNDCLLMKHLQIFFNRIDLPLVNMIWAL